MKSSFFLCLSTFYIPQYQTTFTFALMIFLCIIHVMGKIRLFGLKCDLQRIVIKKDYAIFYISGTFSIFHKYDRLFFVDILKTFLYQCRKGSTNISMFDLLSFCFLARFFVLNLSPILTC